MHVLSRYMGAERSLEGDLLIGFAVEDEPATLEKLNKLSGIDLILDVSKFSKKRSLNANAYLWKLCDLIAKKLGSDKDTIYLMMLKNYGVFETLEVIDKAVYRISELYRFVEEDYRYTALRENADGELVEMQMVALRCYKGSHEYDSKEMAELIDGAVNDAHDLGIDTWTQAEIDNLIQNWSGR